MVTTGTTELFEKLERSLLSLVGSGDTANYEQLAQYLSLAQEIHSIAERFKAITDQKDAATSPSSKKSASTTRDHRKMVSASCSTINPGEPVYFVHGSSLVKMGLSSSESGGLYKKVVPLAAVEMICSEMETQLAQRQSISSVDIQLKLSMPSYKVQITIMALVAAGALQQIGRGRYTIEGALRTIPTKKKLLEKIQSLPARADLLKQYASQNQETRSAPGTR